jgi:hypothetical protein
MGPRSCKSSVDTFKRLHSVMSQKAVLFNIQRILFRIAFQQLPGNNMLGYKHMDHWQHLYILVTEAGGPLWPTCRGCLLPVCAECK